MTKGKAIIVGIAAFVGLRYVRGSGQVTTQMVPVLLRRSAAVAVSPVVVRSYSPPIVVPTEEYSVSGHEAGGDNIANLKITSLHIIKTNDIGSVVITTSSGATYSLNNLCETYTQASTQTSHASTYARYSIAAIGGGTYKWFGHSVNQS